MKKTYLFWLADYAAGIAAALSLGLVALLIAGWVGLFMTYLLAGILLTVLSVVMIAMLIRAVPYVRKRADERRELEPDEESLSGLLRQLKQARTERELREKQSRGRRS